MTRRPPACRPNTPAEDAVRDARAPADPAGRSDYATFEYREEAAAAGRLLTGWDTWPQYFGFLDLWAVMARRRSWTAGRQRVLRTDGGIR
mgnify:CR=1 FL=1